MPDLKLAQNKAFWRKYGDIIVIDTEFQYSREIIQFSACRLVGPDWKVVDEISIYVKPLSGIRGGIQPIITQLTGITTEMVESEGLEPVDAAKKIASFVNKGTAFASYAGLEDLYLLQNLFFKTGVQCPKIFTERRIKSDKESCKFIDVSLMAKLVMPDILETINQDDSEHPITMTNILSLDKMCKLVGIEVDGTQLHRAYYDVELITKLFINLFERIYPKYGEIPVIKWERNHMVLKLYPTWALSDSKNDMKILKDLKYGNALVGSRKKRNRRRNRRRNRMRMRTNTKNIVFLDIDGVLNNDFTTDDCCGFTGIDDEKIELLKKIVVSQNASIVLISTWREYWEKEEKEKQDELANYLDKKFEKFGLKVLDKTEDDYCHRGNGILDYVKKHEIKNYVILDDEDFVDYDLVDITSHLIKTSPRYGLVEDNVQDAIKILSNKSNLNEKLN